MLNARKDEEAEQAVTVDLSDLKGKRVLIIEDDGMTQMHLQLALTRMGLNVIGMAAREQEAIEAALQERPEIILADIHLLDGDGLDAIRLILEVYHPCIVMLTAYSDEQHRSRANQLGVCGYMVKPVNTDIITRHLLSAYQTFLSPRHQPR